jgi:hypothetical protein
MASLSGNKIKDTYNLLLKLESSEASSSEQVVEDGAGNNTALKLSTDTVETTGELKISGTPSTSTSLTTALMLSTSGVVVTRDLSTNPIGTTSITPNLPITATGSTVGLADPAALTQITNPATIDKYLVWDESASEYKYIESQDLANSVSITALSPLTATGSTVGVRDADLLTQLPASSLAGDDKYIIFDSTETEYKYIDSIDVVPVSAPITKTVAGEVTIDDPINISQITSPAGDDKYLIWDESVSAYKYIDQDDLKASVSGDITNMMVAKNNSSNSVSSTATTAVIWADVCDDSSVTGTSVATSSVLFGQGAAGAAGYIFRITQVDDPNDAVQVYETVGWVRCTANIVLSATANVGCYLEITQNRTATKTTLTSVDVDIAADERKTVTLSAVFYSDGQASDEFMIRGIATAANVTAHQESNFMVEYLGANTSF